MDQLIENFPAQLKEALQIGREAKLSSATQEIKQVLISGLGGSGIGGDLTRQFSQNNATLPIASNKDYLLPNYVNEHTLLIISSYSGNTEETISAFEEAMKRGLDIFIISVGGKLLNLATEYSLPYIQMPDTGIQPRSALGFSFAAMLKATGNEEALGDLKELASSLDPGLYEDRGK
ncbi:MAG: bifunctional phosphoglucose/phosphomannose isomerase, partial [Bacteroidetes bacterium]|nr:bifunctional phosphoglucose/phosphomannose isomerase [Bacteroidota bacterium]